MGNRRDAHLRPKSCQETRWFRKRSRSGQQALTVCRRNELIDDAIAEKRG